jgi:hypothetical protein
MQKKNICFIMMPFSEKFEDVLNDSIRPAVESNNLLCLRADEIWDTGKIPDQIANGIQESLVCIADLTNLNINVVYEVALAHEKGKSVILITQDSPDSLPFDLRHYRAFKYISTHEGRQKLRETLERSLLEIIKAPESKRHYLEDMLIPRSLGDIEGKFIIAASPLSWREAAKVGGGFRNLRRTSSDHVGIRGLIQAFGMIFGLERLPDLLDPDDFEDEVVQENAANFYCIGSPKANRWSGLLLENFYKRWRPRFEFKADPTSPDLRNIRVRLEMDGNRYKPHNFGKDENDPFTKDFGILVRGPHPADSKFIFMVMAGRSALGTEAVCHAATDPAHIAEIKRRLHHDQVELSDHKKAFWAIVSITRDTTKGGAFEADLSSLEIAEVHAFRRAR